MKITFEGEIDAIKAEVTRFLENMGVQKNARTEQSAYEPTPATQEEGDAAETSGNGQEPPKKQARKPRKPAAKAEEPKAEEPEAEIIDKASLREKGKAFISEHGKEKFAEILSEFDCRTFGQLQDDQLIDFLKALEAVEAQ